VVLGSETPIIHELQQPAPLHQWAQSLQAPALHPIAVPTPPAAVPPVAVPPAGATPVPLGASAAIAAAPASLPTDAVRSAPPAAATATGSVSLKDIARSAAREAVRELILRMLTRTRWNRKEAAENLGISYKALLYKIKENGLDKAS
jgi:DNA-binding NtrC family response regulator